MSLNLILWAVLFVAVRMIGIKLNKILMNQKEEAAALVALNAQLQKANGEIQAKIQALQDAITNAPVSDEVAAAVADLTKSTQALDDIVPDTTPAP